MTTIMSVHSRPHVYLSTYPKYLGISRWPRFAPIFWERGIFWWELDDNTRAKTVYRKHSRRRGGKGSNSSCYLVNSWTYYCYHEVTFGYGVEEIGWTHRRCVGSAFPAHTGDSRLNMTRILRFLLLCNVAFFEFHTDESNLEENIPHFRGCVSLTKGYPKPWLMLGGYTFSRHANGRTLHICSLFSPSRHHSSPSWHCLPTFEPLLKRGRSGCVRAMVSHRTEPKEERNEYLIAWGW